MSTSIKAAGFIVMTAEAIFGSGRTEAEAATDAKSWVDIENRNQIPSSVTDDDANILMHGGFAMVAATEALIQQVEEKGGDIAWGLVGGVACTCEEEEAAL